MKQSNSFEFQENSRNGGSVSKSKSRTKGKNVLPVSASNENENDENASLIDGKDRLMSSKLAEKKVDVTVSLPSKSEWKECCVPVKKLLTEFKLTVQRKTLTVELAVHILFMILLLSYAGSYFHNELSIQRSLFVSGFTGERGTVRIPEDQYVVLNASVSRVQSLGALHAGKELHDWSLWKIYTDTVVLYDLCNEYSNGKCIYDFEVRQKKSARFQNCYDNYQPKSPDNLMAFSNATLNYCLKNVFRACFGTTFSDYTGTKVQSGPVSSPNWDASFLGSGEAEALPINVCQAAEGSADGHSGCVYDENDWIKISFPSDPAKFAQRENGMFKIQYSDVGTDPLGKLTFANNETRSLSISSSILVPGANMIIYESIAADVDLSGNFISVISTINYSLDSVTGISGGNKVSIIFLGMMCFMYVVQLLYKIFKRSDNLKSLISFWFFIDSIQTIFCGFIFVVMINVVTNSTRNNVVDQFNKAQSSSTECELKDTIKTLTFRVEILGVSIFTAFLRLFKYLTLLKPVQVVRLSLNRTTKNLVSVVSLAFLVFFTFTIAAMLLFGHYGLSFLDFIASFITLNILLIGGNVDTTYLEMKGSMVENNVFPPLFFIAFQILFYWFLRAVLLAVAIEAFRRVSHDQKTNAEINLRMQTIVKVNESRNVDFTNKYEHKYSVGRDKLRTFLRILVKPHMWKEALSRQINVSTKLNRDRKHHVKLSDALDRLEFWSRQSENRLKTFITYDEILDAVSRISIHRRLKVVDHDQIIEIMNTCGAVNIYTIEEARSLERSWELALGAGVKFTQPTATEIAKQTKRTQANNINFSDYDDRSSEQIQVDLSLETLREIQLEMDLGLSTLCDNISNLRDKQRAMVDALREMDATLASCTVDAEI